jgi:hypothetical protein
MCFSQDPNFTIWGHYTFFRKFAEIFTAQDAPLVTLTPVANGKIFLKKFHYFFDTFE